MASVGGLASGAPQQDSKNGKREVQVYHVAWRWTPPKPDSAEIPYADADLILWNKALGGHLLPCFDDWVYQLEDSHMSSASSLIPELKDGAAELAEIEADHKANLHFQGYGHFSDKVGKHRPVALAQAFQQLLGGLFWMRPASTAGKEALKEYCLKSDTRVAGPWTCKVRFTGKGIIKPDSLRPFQRSLIDLIQSEADDRTIYWVTDTTGGAGKTAFLKYCVFNKLAFLLQYGNAADLNNLVYNNPNQRCYIFDLTRSKPAVLSSVDVFAVMESCKNGMIQNTKYKTGFLLMDSPHVIVFSNSAPDISLLSADRWRIFNIDANLELVPA